MRQNILQRIEQLEELYSTKKHTDIPSIDKIYDRLNAVEDILENQGYYLVRKK